MTFYVVTLPLDSSYMTACIEPQFGMDIYRIYKNYHTKYFSNLLITKQVVTIRRIHWEVSDFIVRRSTHQICEEHLGLKNDAIKKGKQCTAWYQKKNLQQHNVNYVTLI